MPATRTSYRAGLRRGLIVSNYIVILYLTNLWLNRKRRRRRIRRWYVKPINVYRPVRSEYHLLVNDFYNLNETEGHKEYFRMDVNRMKDLLDRIGPLLEHRPLHAMPIGPALRLSLTIKYLASGDSLKNMAKCYRNGYQTALNIVYEVCDALWSNLQPEFLRIPTEEDWQRIAQRFWERWNFPLCLGAVDGKHVVIKKPANAGSAYFNYKLDHSIVLMAVADADYSFIYVDVGSYGRSHDGGVFSRSAFGKALADDSTNLLGIPGFHNLPGSNVRCPHVFVGDDAFPIFGHLIKPYGGKKRTRAERIFDYRLSRARGVIENTFGIMTARWRVFCQTIACSPDNVERIVKAAVVLHNYLKKTDSAAPPDNRYVPPTLIDYVDEDTGDSRGGRWRDDVPADAALRNLSICKNRSKYGMEVRDRIKTFFQTEAGSVPWQDRRFRATE